MRKRYVVTISFTVFVPIDYTDDDDIEDGIHDAIHDVGFDEDYELLHYTDKP